MIQDHYLRIPLGEIHVPESRQRKSVDTSDLLLSIRLRGVIQPIIVEGPAASSPRYTLIAGERRFRASRELGLADIPARLASELSRVEREIIELEENVKRKDLSWQDEALAFDKLNSLLFEINAEWSQIKSADYMGVSQGLLSMYIQVAEEIRKENKNVLAAGGIRAAYNLIARRTERGIADVMNELLEEPNVGDVVSSTISMSESTHDNVGSIQNNGPPGSIHKESVQRESILKTSFLTFAPMYSGPPFNFIHCDFPYGINHDKSDQGNSDVHGSYSDSPEIYWELCHCLATNVNKLMTPSAHLMFWLSSDIERQYETIQFFRREAPGLVFRTVPLYWFKTDNRGILPDPNRGPRQVVETALMASRGDRQIVRAVSNCYGSPTTKEIHQSEKPEPMLRHFFGMLVDENTRLFDPTCGSGSALRAAESLGAKTVLGLELNDGFADAARIALRKARNLREMVG